MLLIVIDRNFITGHQMSLIPEVEETREVSFTFFIIDYKNSGSARDYDVEYNESVAVLN